MFVSYAQNFEDVMLWRALRAVEHGVYIDVGAQDPVVDSVSMAFHERGWRGVHVEPEPHYAEMLRKSRSGDVVIEAAVGSAGPLVTFYAIPDTGISTVDPEIAESHRSRGLTVRETLVPCVPLAAIFAACAGPEIHWLKIDIEGSEQSAIVSWGDDPRLPWIVVVESTLPLSQVESHAAWEPMLLGRGYRAAYFDGLNRYYVSPRHPELAAVLSLPPNVFDDFAVNGTASTTLHKLILSRHGAEIAAERSRSSEQLAWVERERAAAEAAHGQQVIAARDLAQNFEALRRDLDRQQRAVVEQAEALSRASALLTTVGLEHAATVAALQNRHRTEVEGRMGRERELESQVGRAAAAAEAARRHAIERESTLAERFARTDRELREEHAALALGMRAREDAMRQQLDDAAAQIRSQLSGNEAQARDLALLRQQREGSERQGAALRAELRTIHASWSWRLLHGPAAGRDPVAEGDASGEDAVGTAPESTALFTSLDSTPILVTEGPSMSTKSIDPYVRVSNVQELLLLHDVVFVNSAYWAVLNRQADRGGRADYLSQLRAGEAKEEILANLVRSDEGRRVAATLSGLEKVVAAHEASRLNLPQRIVRRLFKGAGADLERNFRRLENLMVRHANAMTSRLEGMEIQLLKIGDESAAGRLGAETDRAEAAPRTGDRGAAAAGDDAPLGLQTLTEQERFLLRKIAKL